MDAIQEFLRQRVADLLGRVQGPLHFRLVIMPLVAASVAIRAGLRDARDGRPSFIIAVLTAHGEARKHLRQSWLTDLRRVLVVGLVIDTVYQLLQLRAFYPGQALVVALVLAVMPYLFFRSPIRWIVHAFHRGSTGPAGRSARHQGVGPPSRDQ